MPIVYRSSFGVVIGLLAAAIAFLLAAAALRMTHGDYSLWRFEQEHPVYALLYICEIWSDVPEGYHALVLMPTILTAAGCFAGILRLTGRRRGDAWNDSTVRGARLVLSEGSAGGNLVRKAMSRWRPDDSLQIGTVRIDRAAEVEHILISGATGTGKSQIMDGLLRTLRARGDRCVVIDHSGGFLSRHGQQGDLLLNPFDRRSPSWSPFAEIETDYDYRRVANAIIPEAVGGGEKAEWICYAQTLLSDVLRVLHINNERSPQVLHRLLTSASPEHLRRFLEGTTSAIFSERENARLLGSVRGVMSPYIGFLQYLRPTAGREFSVRRYIRQEDRKSWLFLPYREDQMDELRAFLSCVSGIAMLEALSLSESADRRLFFFLDELTSLGHLGRVPDMLTKLRKLGGCVVLAVQVLSQLRAVYGDDMAKAIIGNAATKVILRQGDAETAKIWEAQLGEREVKRVTGSRSESRSAPFRPSTTGESANTQIVRESIVLASELMAMRNLEGIIIRPGNPHTRFNMPYVEMPRRYAGFVPLPESAAQSAATGWPRQLTNCIT